jgi:N-acetylmuramoyl-L-alanine amidase
MESRKSRRRASGARAAAWIVAAAAASPVAAGRRELPRAWDEPVEVRAVQPRPLEDGLRLEIQLSGPASFRCRTLRHPDRIAIDILGARLVGMPYELRVGLGGVERIWARPNSSDTVRVVAGLAQPMHVESSHAGEGAITVDLRPGRDEKRTEAAGSGPRADEHSNEAPRDERRRATKPGREEKRRPAASAREERDRDRRHRMEKPVEEPAPFTIPEPRFPPPAAVDPAAVTGLSARNLSPDTAEIRLQAGRRLDYKILRLEQPARYVVDLPGGRDGLFCSPLVEGKGLLGHRDVRTGQFTKSPPVFRLVVRLPDRAWAEVRTEDSGELVVEVSRRPRSPIAKGGTQAEAPGRKGAWPAVLVGIDPGHGGSDPGATPMVGMSEKEITLDVALRVRELLSQMGVATAMTRREDRRLPVKERVRFVGRADLDLFISIHCDAAESTSATGVTTYVHGWAPAPKSRALAVAIQGELVRATGLPDRGVRSDKNRFPGGGFYVLRYSASPAVLIEAGYVSHPPTSLLLSQPAFRQRVAQGIVAGLQKYWESIGARRT